VHLVAFDEDEETVKPVQVFSHPKEVWGIQASPADASLFFTSFQEQENEFKASMWQLPEAKGALKEKLSFSLKSLALAMVWQPASETAPQSDRIVTVHHDSLCLWQLSRPDQPQAKFELKEPSASCAFFHGSWDLHHPNSFVTAQGYGMSVWDLRTLQAPSQVLGGRDVVRSVDHNPNKPFYVLSAGDDRRLRVYDLRKGSQPLKELPGHNHWAWTARYNHFHDQLLLSAGTDGGVKLWSALSVSSALLGELEDPLNEREGDRLVSSYSHEESVYSVCWSAFDAWAFASLSSDGRMVVHLVPSAEKYKILL